MRKILNQTLVFGLAAVMVFADQYSKYWVRTHLAVGESWSPWPWLMPYARILHTENTGAAFGMFKSGGLIFTVIAIVVSVAIVYYTRQLPPGQWWIRVTLGLQLGGALGNLIDRLVRGPVTDFISVGTFAIFNVADSSISVGVAVLALLMWLEARQPKPPADPVAPPADADPAAPSA